MDILIEISTQATYQTFTIVIQLKLISIFKLFKLKNILVYNRYHTVDYNQCYYLSKLIYELFLLVN